MEAQLLNLEVVLPQPTHTLELAATKDRTRRKNSNPTLETNFHLEFIPSKVCYARSQGVALENKSLIHIYQCLCDETRLRILNLLNDGPLCVSHLQEILGEPQVKISKHLAYLKSKDIVRARRHRNMMIYHLPIEGNQQLEINLLCLRECVKAVPVFINDKEKLYRLVAQNDWLTEVLGSKGLGASRFSRRTKPKVNPLRASSVAAKG